MTRKGAKIATKETAASFFAPLPERPAQKTFHAKHRSASATGRYRDETLFARSPLRAFAESSASCSENKSGFQANFNGPCDLQSISCPGCRRINRRLPRLSAVGRRKK